MRAGRTDLRSAGLVESGEVASFDFDADSLTALICQLSRLGAAARWINRFMPTIMPKAEVGTCAPYPFAHLKIGARQALRQAYAAFMNERVARFRPAVRIYPQPVLDTGSGSGSLVLVNEGCLFCGVGAQPVAADEVAREGMENIARAIWTPKRAPITSLGGQLSAGSVSGYLCKVCADAHAHVGSIDLVASVDSAIAEPKRPADRPPRQPGMSMPARARLSHPAGGKGSGRGLTPDRGNICRT